VSLAGIISLGAVIGLSYFHLKGAPQRDLNYVHRDSIFVETADKDQDGMHETYLNVKGELYSVRDVNGQVSISPYKEESNGADIDSTRNLYKR
jgi:hypothetical protein